MRGHNKIRKYALTLVLIVLLCACAQQVENTAADGGSNSEEWATDNQPAGFVPYDVPADEATIVLSKTSGNYESDFLLTMEAPAGYHIYYTLDGRDPMGDAGILYDGEISIEDRRGKENILSAIHPTLFCANNNKRDTNKQYYCLWEPPTDAAVDKAVCLRAACVNGDGAWSRETRANYFIGDINEHIPGVKESCEAAGNRLAVICMTVDEDDLFDETCGIYVKGDRFAADYLEPHVKGDARNVDANYKGRGREWEREASIEFYEVDDRGMEYAFGQNCGIRIQGNYSRSDLQKSFRFYARNEYGNKRFENSFFGSEAPESYKTFILRAGGNCALTCKYSDIYWQTLVRQAGLQVDTKYSRPCVLYINGEYWGHYVMEEDYSKHYYADHYGVDADDVVIYKGDAETYSLGYKLDEGSLPEGETEDYYFKDLMQFFKEHENCTSQDDYDKLCKLVDPQSVLDYFAIEVWINNKWDWPGKNWSMWRTISPEEGNAYGDGRWRFSLYDAEFGGVSGSGDARTNTIKEDNYKPEGLLDKDTKNPAVLCFAYLMTNTTFRAKFAVRLTELSEGAFEKEHALDVLGSFEDTYGPLMDQFFERFPGSGSKKEALQGGYASSKCIRDFLSERADYIPEMIQYFMLPR